MYKKFLLLIVLLFINTTINAQDKDEFAKSVDYCACKIAYAYTQDFANKNPDKDEYKSFNDVIKPKIENCDENTLSIADLEKLLKDNNFKGFAKSFISEVENAKEKYTDTFSKTKAIDVIINCFKSSLEKIDIKEDLKTDLQTKLNSFKTNSNIETNDLEENEANSNIENEVITLNNKLNYLEKEEQNNSFFPNWLLFLLILLSATLLFIYNYLNNKKLSERIDKQLSESQKEINQIKNNLNQSNNRNKNNSEFERTFSQKISDLNFAIEKLQKENSNKHVLQQNKRIDIPKNTQNNQNLQKQSQKIVYAKTPIEEKIFNSLDVSEEKEAKFYKFTINNNENEAQFEFFNNENSAKRALNSPDNFLYYVCEGIEPLNQNAKRIITKKKGVAIKQNNQWIVTEKAQITYE